MNKTHDHEARKEKKTEGNRWRKLIGRELTRADLIDPIILKKLHAPAAEAGGRVALGDAGLFDFFAQAHCAWRVGKGNPVGLFWSAIYGRANVRPAKEDDDWANEMLVGPKRAPVGAFAAAVGPNLRNADEDEPRAPAPLRRSPAEQLAELRKRSQLARMG